VSLIVMGVIVMAPIVVLVMIAVFIFAGSECAL
jgi:hypothetical protein